MSTARDRRDAARSKLEARMAEKAAAARRRRLIQVGIGSFLALALLSGLGVYIFNTLAAGSGGSGPKDDRVEAGDGHPKDDVVIESLTMSKPASTDKGEASCKYKPASKDEMKQNTKIKDVGSPGDDKQPDTGTQKMNVKLSQGDVQIEVDNSQAPCTAASFTYLAGKDFFTDSKCHRVTTEQLYVLQCGDPSGTGQGGPAYSFKNEHAPKDTAKDLSKKDQEKGKQPKPNYKAGSIAMANSGPDTNGSQFFLVYKDTYLPPDYTLFGKMTKGLDVVKGIADKGAWLTPEEQQQMQQQQQQQQQQVPMG